MGSGVRLHFAITGVVGTFVTIALITGAFEYLNDIPIQPSHARQALASTKGSVTQKLSAAQRGPWNELEGSGGAVRVSGDDVDVFSHKSLYKPSHRSSQFRPLTPKVIESVEKFVFFVGYPRSGHSIIGSMMDAHPNMIVPHEYMLFRRMTKGRNLDISLRLWNKTTIFNALYQKSRRDVKQKYGVRHPTNDRKGYTLNVGTPWHGTFNRTLKVIGDKSGGQTVMAYNREQDKFKRVLSHLHHSLGIPIRVIHVVRNPYDIIATDTLYHTHPANRGLYFLYTKGKVNKTSLKGEFGKLIARHIPPHIGNTFRVAAGVDKMIRMLNLTVLEIHSADFVRNPRETISRICTFLEVPCPEDYLQACYDKAYKTSSKSRNLIEWPEKLIKVVQKRIKDIPFFKRYTFEGD